MSWHGSLERFQCSVFDGEVSSSRLLSPTVAGGGFPFRQVVLAHRLLRFSCFHDEGLSRAQYVNESLLEQRLNGRRDFMFFTGQHSGMKQVELFIELTSRH